MGTSKQVNIVTRMTGVARVMAAVLTCLKRGDGRLVA